ncbi:MAG: S8 family serine peptidase [Prevotellaceae bacterium]|nr:S8 family serine peptidase [Prevotellaceae bacterium]
MKKIFFIGLLCAFYITGTAAPLAQPGQQREWLHKSFETDSVYGAGVDNAYRLIQGRTPAKTVTVALVGYGMDVGHKDLAGAVWTNLGEKPNGKDDDKNGYIDDLHGWNFLGTPDGKSLNRLSRVGDREFFRLKDKYAHYIFADNKCYTLDTSTQQVVEIAPPPDSAEFDYFRNMVMPESPIGGRYMGVLFARMVVSFVHSADKELRQKYPEKTLSKRDFESTYDGDSPDMLRNTFIGSVQLLFMSAGSEKWDDVVKFADTEYVQYQQRGYERELQNTFLGERKYIGDDPYNINDKSYGNNNLASANADQGTLLAGIIGARRGNGTGIDGIAANVKIMPLRIDADYYGEPYMKDMANAIRYAVNKGADIIQLGKTNAIYPRPWSQWVDEALRYAEQKDALVVIPMMDLSYSLDDKPFYPTRRVAGGELSNIITVAASDADGNPYLTVNFSSKELDLFAPGVAIKSILDEDTYSFDFAPGIAIKSNSDKKLQPFNSGSEVAAAVVSGVAALIKGCYPEITPAEMRKLLMDSVTPRSEAEVEKSFVMHHNGTARRVKDVFMFKDLCVSGGILNAEKALTEAAKQYGKK